MEKTFAELCNAAYAQAKADAKPFTPSNAQFEAAIKPVVHEVATRVDARSFVRATYQNVGLMPRAVSMLKERGV